MEREKAFEILKENIQNRNLIKHSLAVEAAMKSLATFFNQDEKEWGICGLMHDIDYEKTKGQASSHSKVGSEMLKDLGLSEEICQAVLTHNEALQLEPKSLMARALFCVDPLTGLIVAAVLVSPSRKINELKTENVLNRFKEKAFAKGANRAIIKKCETYLDLSLEGSEAKALLPPLEKFIEIVLKAMQKISEDLEL